MMSRCVLRGGRRVQLEAGRWSASARGFYDENINRGGRKGLPNDKSKEGGQMPEKGEVGLIHLCKNEGKKS